MPISHWFSPHWLGTDTSSGGPSSLGSWWVTSLNSMLSQHGQLRTIDRNEFGVTTVTTITTTRCFVFQDTEERQRSVYRLTKTVDYVALLPSSLDLIAKTDDQITMVVNTHGRIVVSAGTLTEITRFEHWEHGLQFLAAGIRRVS